MHNRSDFPDLFNLSIRAENYLTMAHEMVAPVSDRIFDWMESSLKSETVSELDGYESAEVVAEGENLPEGRLTEGYDKTFTHSLYGKVVPVSYEARRDDPKGALSRFDTSVQAHANAIINTREAAAALLLTNGFTSTTVPDGTYLFATNHPVSPADATTKSNKLTAKLTGAGAIQSAFELAGDNLVSMANHPIVVNDWMLVVPTALKAAAIESVKEMYGVANAKLSSVATGDLMGNIEVLEWRYLNGAMGGSDTAWFLIANPASYRGRHSLRGYWRLRPTVREQNGEDSVGPWVNQSNGCWNVPIRARWDLGAISWRYAIGSDGSA